MNVGVQTIIINLQSGLLQYKHLATVSGCLPPSSPTVHLFSENKALIVNQANHRTHMLWRKESE